MLRQRVGVILDSRCGSRLLADHLSVKFIGLEVSIEACAALLHQEQQDCEYGGEVDHRTLLLPELLELVVEIFKFHLCACLEGPAMSCTQVIHLIERAGKRFWL